MARETKVVDASIGLKWFCQEEGSEEAMALLLQHSIGTIQIIVPDLFFYEVMNALRYKKDITILPVAIESLFSARLGTITPNAEAMKKCMELAVKHGLTIYDAMYLSLAEIMKSECITADKKILASKHKCVRGLFS